MRARSQGRRRVSRPSRAELLAWAAKQESLDRVPVRSRDSSTSSSGREVRCACQYFQTDSLLPERQSLVGKPHIRHEGMMTSRVGDHEYEPVAPPPPMLRVTDTDSDLGLPSALGGSETSSVSGDRRFLRIPLDEELVVPEDGTGEDEIMAGEELGGNGDINPQELQSRLEERYLAHSPTTESRTDADITTSQVDSSALENLPLKRGARTEQQLQASLDRPLPPRHKTAVSVAADATSKSIQRIRSQADKIKTKFQNMSMPERPKFNIHMPERPKFTMPERPKFNLPERPKFNLPERPKFHLPERPKITFPERPKFTVPNWSLPRPSFPTNRRKQKKRENEESGTTGAKKKFDFDFKTYPRIFDRKAKRTDYVTSSPKMPKRSQTPPPRPEPPKRPKLPPRKKGPVGQRWVHKFSDIRYADDENQPPPDDMEEFDEEVVVGNELADDLRDKEGNEFAEAFRDKVFDYDLNVDDDGGLVVGGVRRGGFRQEPAVVPVSSFSQLESGAESDRDRRSSGSSRRPGVLEEIDSDEFFLRQKGISQEDVNVGRYLSSEIREAFRSPVNTLEQMDVDLVRQYRSTPERVLPTRPARTYPRYKKPRPRARQKKAAAAAISNLEPSEFFNTFPPARPMRMRRGRQTPYNEYPTEEARYEVPPGEQETPEIKEEEEIAQEVVEPTENIELTPVVNGDIGLYDNIGDSTPPLPPKRIKKERKGGFVQNGYHTWSGTYSEAWLKSIEHQAVPEEAGEMKVEHEYIVPATIPEGYYDVPPLPPRRAKRIRSSQPSGTDPSQQELFVDVEEEDRTSRGAESLPPESLISEQGLDAPEPGYASVIKAPERTRRQKQVTPTVRTRRKKSMKNGVAPRPRGYSYFFTLPKRTPRTYYIVAPTRPARTYSTLKPSRPARKIRVVEAKSDEVPYESAKEDIPVQNGTETLPLPAEEERGASPTEESQGSGRDLQSGDVIEKMKGRPLPPPPRPPRKTRKEGEEEAIVEATEAREAETIPTEPAAETEPEIMSILDKEESVAIGALSDDVFYSQRDSIVSSPTSEHQQEVIVPETVSVTKAEINVVAEETIALETVSMSKEESLVVAEEEPLRVAKVEEATLERAVPVQVIEEVLVVETVTAVEEASHIERVEPEPRPVEVSVATQTDPLPDDVCMDGDEFEAEEVVDVAARSDVGTSTSPERQKEIPSSPLPPPVPERVVPVYVMPGPDAEVELQASKLRLSELDVERINVTELQAQRILVSDIDGMTLQVSELSSQSGHLVVTSIEPHPSLMRARAEAQSAESGSRLVVSEASVSSPPPASTASGPSRDTRGGNTSASVPPSKADPPSSSPVEHSTPEVSPIDTVHSQAIQSIDSRSVQSAPVISESIPKAESPPVPTGPVVSPQFSPTKEQDKSRTESSAVPRTVVQEHITSSSSSENVSEHPVSQIPPGWNNRAAALQTRAVLTTPSGSSDEEEEFCSCPSSPIPPIRSPESAVSSPEPSIPELTTQLANACCNASMRAVRSLLQYMMTQLRTSQEEQGARSNLQISLCIVLVLVAGLIMLGFGSNTVHHHHWDFFYPPP